MKPTTLIQQTAISAQGSKQEVQLQAGVGAPRKSKLKSANQKVTACFPELTGRVHFSPAELQSGEAKIHQALGGASKERWSFGEPPKYDLLNGLTE